MVIGKGGETIRGLSEEFEAQIDVQDDGTSSIYARTASRATPSSSGSASMTKEVEVGDEFTGKVVKTTTFGAFVELSKGTDGLLHISNVSPGQRVETVEDVLNRGDEIDVRVVEVDKERGRIGLRLADDPEIAGQDRRGARRESAPATAAATAAAAAAVAATAEAAAAAVAATAATA